jgi:hypothetical protein
VNTQTSPARGLSRRSENDADLRASWRHSDDRSNN